MNYHSFTSSTPRKIINSEEHILRDILCAQIRLDKATHPHEQRVLREALAELQAEAQKAFATLNGWKGGRRECGLGWDDHSIRFFKGPGTLALVGQPYGSPEMYTEEVAQYAREHRMRWHSPPMPYASFWLPGSTLFYVVAKPEVEVQWLPEQLTDDGFREFHELEPILKRKMNIGANR
jgi:hypothetical protein